MEHALLKKKIQAAEGEPLRKSALFGGVPDGYERRLVENVGNGR